MKGKVSLDELDGAVYDQEFFVRNHLCSIYDKLNVKGRREAVTKAFGLGLISE